MISEPPMMENGARLSRIERPAHPRLGRMRFLSRLLDNSILLPGGYRIGLDPLLGLVPGIGDFVGSTLSFWLIYDAARLGLRKRVLARMAGNVLVESLAGMAPVLGDVFDAAWKANARNMALVEKHYSPGGRERSFGGIAAALGLALVMFYGIIIGSMYVTYRLLMAVWNALI